MKGLRTLWVRVQGRLHKHQFDTELEAEMRSHIEMQTQENIAAGMSPEDAARAARKSFGNVQNVREDCRQVGGANLGESIAQDVRFGWRMLFKAPGFTAMAVISLAIGIGLNVTIFNALDVLFLAPIEFKNPGTIVRLNGSLCYPDYTALASQCHSLSGIAGLEGHMTLLRQTDGQNAYFTEYVSPNYFSVLGIGAAVGNVFSEHDARLKNQSVVVISHRLWQDHFGGDPNIVGRTIRLEQECTVIGVVQKGYNGAVRVTKTDVWYPFWPGAQNDRRYTGLTLIGRRAPGTSAGQVQTEIDTIANRLALKNPTTGQLQRIQVSTEMQSTLAEGKVALLALPLAALVLLVACTNVSSMLLARNEERRREMAVRVALGANRWRLVRQLLVESTLLALLGTGLGLLFTIWATSALIALVPQNFIQLAPRLGIDHRAFMFAICMTVFAILAFGLAPAWRASKTDLTGVLKGSDAVPKSRWARLRGRNVLVVGQLVVSVVFLVSAGLMVKGFVKGANSDLGFEKKSILHITIGGKNARQLAEEFAERVRALPGVSHATLAWRPPLALTGGGATLKMFIPGDQSVAGTEGHVIPFNIVEPDYFQLLGIRVVRGRAFTATDDKPAPPVMIISEAMAHRYWPGEDPIGKSVQMEDLKSPPIQIIGVAHDVVHTKIGGTADPLLYLPFRQRDIYEMTLLAETKGDPAAVLGLIRKEMHAMDPDFLPIFVDTQNQLIRFALMPQWASAWLFGVLGLLAFGMSAAGLYGVISYSVMRRTHEIGLRMALGAQRTHTLRMVLKQGLVLSLVGLAIGLPAACGVGYVLRSLLFGLSPADPTLLLGTSLIIISVSLLSAYFPARRAVSVDPMTALRCE